MVKKGIAVPYIIALILGIIVVGVIGYWFFTTTTTGGGSATFQQCNAKKTQWCIEWSKTGFSTTSKPASLGTWDLYAVGCTAIGVGEPTSSVCQSLTGLGTASNVGKACAPGTAGDTFCTPLKCDSTTRECK
mgnify:CR=1 FL=1